MLKRIDSSPSPSTCDFCNEFAGSQSNRFSQIYSEESNRIIESSHSYNVIPSLGQLTEGHVLIVPKVHATALADMKDDQLRELDILYLEICRRLQKSYGAHIAFEHGTRGPNAGGCGIVHAHLHVLPCSRALEFPSDIPIRRIDEASFYALRACVSPYTSYLWFRDQEMRAFIAEVNYLPSQYLRKIVAKALGIPEWDWRASPFQDSLFRTVERIKTASTVG